MKNNSKEINKELKALGLHKAKDSLTGTREFQDSKGNSYDDLGIDNPSIVSNNIDVEQNYEADSNPNWTYQEDLLINKATKNLMKVPKNSYVFNPRTDQNGYVLKKDLKKLANGKTPTAKDVKRNFNITLNSKRQDIHTFRKLAKHLIHLTNDNRKVKMNNFDLGTDLSELGFNETDLCHTTHINDYMTKNHIMPIGNIKNDINGRNTIDSNKFIKSPSKRATINKELHNLSKHGIEYVQAKPNLIGKADFRPLNNKIVHHVAVRVDNLAIKQSKYFANQLNKHMNNKSSISMKNNWLSPRPWNSKQINKYLTHDSKVLKHLHQTYAKELRNPNLSHNDRVSTKSLYDNQLELVDVNHKWQKMLKKYPKIKATPEYFETEYIDNRIDLSNMLKKNPQKAEKHLLKDSKEATNGAIGTYRLNARLTSKRLRKLGNHAKAITNGQFDNVLEEFPELAKPLQIKGTFKDGFHYEDTNKYAKPLYNISGKINRNVLANRAKNGIKLVQDKERKTLYKQAGIKLPNPKTKNAKQLLNKIGMNKSKTFNGKHVKDNHKSLSVDKHNKAHKRIKTNNRHIERGPQI